MAAKLSPDVDDEQMPYFIRRCWDRYNEATKEQMEREKESTGFYIGGQFQWREGETKNREGNNRPWLTINRCRPAVDQVSAEARNNPPGPEAHPVGQTDSEVSDIVEGIIREYEYRSGATPIRINALTQAMAGGSGVYEMVTEYENDRSLQQRIALKYCANPRAYFYDPDSTLPGRKDAMWGGKIWKLTREQLIANYPNAKPKILNQTWWDAAQRGPAGWISDATGWKNDSATANIWLGGATAPGPYYVCEFYLVKLVTKKLTKYNNGIDYYEDEEIPESAVPEEDVPSRMVPMREVWKYVTTAYDNLVKPQKWYGTRVPHYWVLGPEVWRDEKCYRLSLIDAAKDAQRGLNYEATSIAEITGTMTKAAFVGWEGQFDVTNAQGFNKWNSSNTQLWPFMEVKPIWTQDPAGIAPPQLLPAPQRNTWEAPIARVLEAATWFGEQIKAATSVFFEPSITSAAQAQSGAAIKALQQQTNIGTAGWQATLHETVWQEYQEALIIAPKLYDGQRVITIVRPDTTQEAVEINKLFPPEEMDHATGKHRKADGTLESTNNLKTALLGIRVNVGANFETRRDKSIETMTEVFKIAPQLLTNPVVTETYLRIVGQGDPEIEALADAINPSPVSTSPEQMQQALKQAQAQLQANQLIIGKLQAAFQAKLPEVEARKWIAAVNAIAGIREAEIKAGVDKADMDLRAFEHISGMAHESTTDMMDRTHESNMADKQAQLQSQQSSQDAAQQAAMQPSGDSE